MRLARIHSRPNGGLNRQNSFTMGDFHNYLRRLVGEFIGTFILTWANAWMALSLSNTAVVFAPGSNNAVNIAADAIGSGLTLTGLVYALGDVSGAHLNPGVSLAFVFRGDMKPLSWFPYALAQFAGGFAAAGILAAVFINDAAHGYLGANQPLGGFTIHSAFWMELLGSALLQLAVVGTACRGKNIGNHAALAAGLTLGALIAILAPYGGGGLNPARSLGPGILANSSSVRGIVWVYVVSPLGAAIFSGLIVRWLAPSKDLYCCEGQYAMMHHRAEQTPTLKEADPEQPMPTQA